MFVTQLGHYPVVLGIPWMELHKVKLDFESRSAVFNSPYCLSHCLSRPTTVSGINTPLPARPVPSIALIGAPAYVRLAKKSKQQGTHLFKMTVSEVKTALGQKTVPTEEEVR